MASTNWVGDEQPNKRQRLSGTNDRSASNDEVPMRTVYVSGIISNWIDRVNSYFGQFGELESVSMQFEDPWTCWCLVQFKREEYAVEALLRTGNHWLGYDVKAADPWHQPDHPLQVAPEQDSDSNISIALNDDCLQAIFECLKPSSLTNVAGVCKRFNAQAKRTFALKHKHLDLSKEFYRHHDLIESAMKHFGKDIQSLIIDASLFSKEVDAYRMIGQNCGPNLKQLELRNFEFQIDSLSLRPIFAGIDRLKLYAYSDSSSLGRLLACCGELKSLSLKNCENNIESIFQQTFPKLQEFSFYFNDFDDEIFEDFVARHQTLIKLSISNRYLPSRLCQHARNLQKLKLIGATGNDAQLQNYAVFIGQQNALKKLQLDTRYGYIVPVLDALVAGEVPIENMNISLNGETDVDRAIICISQLKQIKMLQLKTHKSTRRVTDEDAVELAKCLPELEELHLKESHRYDSLSSVYEFKSELSTIGLRKMLMHAHKLKLLKLHWIGSIKINVDDYKAMLRMVQKRNEKVPLMIEIYGKADQIDVPAAVLAENRSIFNIKLFQLTIFGLYPINLI